MTIEITWAALTAAVGIVATLVKIGLDIRTDRREDQRDMHRLADILRRDIYLTSEEHLPKRRERLRALLDEVNPIRDRLWIVRGKPLEKRGK